MVVMLWLGIVTAESLFTLCCSLFAFPLQKPVVAKGINGELLRMHVMIVDDMKPIRRLVRALCSLRSRGIPVGVVDVQVLGTVTKACTKRTGAAACVDRRQCKLDRAISPF